MQRWRYVRTDKRKGHEYVTHRTCLAADRDVADADVACVFDIDRAAAAAMAAEAGAETALSLDQMAGDGGLDGVSICTPPASHTDPCRPFLDAGIPVLRHRRRSGRGQPCPGAGPLCETLT